MMRPYQNYDLVEALSGIAKTLSSFTFLKVMRVQMQLASAITAAHVKIT